MTTPSTLAINATNAPFYRQTRLGKDSYLQHIQSLNQIRKHHLKRWTVLHSIFHSEKTQPRMKGLKLRKTLKISWNYYLRKIMVWKHCLPTFRSKHFIHREPNNVNTVSGFNFVEQKNPMTFFKFSKILYTVVRSFDKNQLERR